MTSHAILMPGVLDHRGVARPAGPAAPAAPEGSSVRLPAPAACSCPEVRVDAAGKGA